MIRIDYAHAARTTAAALADADYMVSTSRDALCAIAQARHAAQTSGAGNDIITQLAAVESDVDWILHRAWIRQQDLQRAAVALRKAASIRRAHGSDTRWAGRHDQAVGMVLRILRRS